MQYVASRCCPYATPPYILFVLCIMGAGLIGATYIIFIGPRGQIGL